MPILPSMHPGKKNEITHNGSVYARFVVRTPRVDPDTNLESLLIQELYDDLHEGDIVCIAESVVAITQQRAYKISDITPSWWANKLSQYVTKTPAGIGLGMPETMQLAIQEAGLWRILLATAVAAVTRTLGRRGDFYRIAGAKARGIDGPTPGTLPPYNEYATLIPDNPRHVARTLEQALPQQVQVIVVDANDIGVNILGARDRTQELLGEALCADNPMGQGSEQTPLMVARFVGAAQEQSQ